MQQILHCRIPYTLQLQRYTARHIAAHTLQRCQNVPRKGEFGEARQESARFRTKGATEPDTYLHIRSTRRPGPQSGACILYLHPAKFFLPHPCPCFFRERRRIFLAAVPPTFCSTVSDSVPVPVVPRGRTALSAAAPFSARRFMASRSSLRPAAALVSLTRRQWRHMTHVPCRVLPANVNRRRPQTHGEIPLRGTYSLVSRPSGGRSAIR